MNTPVLSSPSIVNSADMAPHPLWASLIQHRRYILANAWQDFLHKYTSTNVGFLWNIIHPVMMVVVFSIVFTSITPARFAGAADVPFIAMLCSGLLPWLSFVDGIQRTTSSLVDNGGYLRKLAIPEEVFTAKSVVGSSILLAINLLVVLVATLLCGRSPHWSWLLLPVTSVLLMLLAFGLGTALGTINVFVRDVAQIVPIVTQAWMWLSPIVYTSKAMPAPLRAVQYFNPIFPFIELLRDQILTGSAGSFVQWLLAFTWTGVALAVGSLVLRRLRGELRDVL